MSVKKGQWMVVGTEEVYKNPWMTVREDKVIRPDGKDGIFGTVSIKPGVCILPVDDAGNVFLIEQYRYMMEGKMIEAVCGGIENGEDPLVAAKRELKEETGIEANEWIDFGEINPFLSMIDNISHLYLAKGLTFSKAIPEETEKIKLIKTTLDQAVNWVMDGRITSSLSAVIILKAREREFLLASKIG